MDTLNPTTAIQWSADKSAAQNIAAAIVTHLTNNASACEAYAQCVVMEEAIKIARENLTALGLQELNVHPNDFNKFNKGRQFVVGDGLIMRVNTVTDYNYTANDDLPVEYYGNVNLAQLEANKAEWQAKIKNYTQLIDARKQAILLAHPRMTPREVKHTLVYCGLNE